MNNWLLFVVIGQFFYAAVVLTDRFIITKGVVPKPIVYTFYVGLLSIFAIGALPFGVTLPSGTTIGLSIIAAVSYVLSIYLLYESLKKSNPSEVVPVVGGIAAISAFISSALILNTGLPGHFLTGFAILVAGMLLISHFRFTTRAFLFLFGSGVFFGLSTVIIKAILENETFVNGFFWSRMANVLVAISFLLVPRIYTAIKEDIGRPNKSGKTTMVVGNKILAGMGFLCILIALKFGNASIVNALTATQYVFLLIFAVFFSKLLPEYFEETVHRHEFLHKSLATGLIVVGFVVLFL
ncbi:MAG: DMT family transporter [Patescibacteria group bacterium]